MFTERVVVNVRTDQLRRLDHIGAVFGCSRSDLVRSLIDTWMEAVESVPEFKALARRDAV